MDIFQVNSSDQKIQYFYQTAIGNFRKPGLFFSFCPSAAFCKIACYRETSPANL